MKVGKFPELRDYRINQLRKRILTTRTGIHASDLDACPNKVYYRRLYPEIETPERSLLFFMSGICAEHWLTPGKLESREKDGIWASPDDLTELGYGEIKSTRSNINYFHPKTSYPHWIFRCKTYCTIFEVMSWNLEVFFWVGDKGKNPIAYDAWKLTFTMPELRQHWLEAIRRKLVLERALEEKMPPSSRIDIKENGWFQAWECGWGAGECEFKEICDYKDDRKR